MQHILLILLIGWSFNVPTVFTFVGFSHNPDLLVHHLLWWRLIKKKQEKSWWCLVLLVSFAETVFTVLWGTHRNNYVTLNIKHLLFPNNISVIFIKKHFNVTMSYSCTLSYTPFSVLGTKIESSLQMRRGKAKHIHTRSSYAYTQYNIPAKTKTEKRGVHHTQTQICFIRILQTWKVNLSSHSLS